MAANKLSAMLQKNTGRIVAILSYAVLEWILIISILLNSLFSYCIRKFAKRFGLKPPCSWCSRVDHVLEPGQGTNSYRDHLCDAHASEVSKLSFCSNHGKLAETHLLCEDCLDSLPNQDGDPNSVEIVSCSCCEKSLSRKFSPLYLLIKALQKGTFVIESVDNDGNGGDKCREPERFCTLEDQAEDIAEMKINDVDDGSANNEEASDEHRVLYRVGNLQCDEKEADGDVKSCEVSITNRDLSITSPFNAVQSCLAEDLMAHIMCPWKCECDCQIPTGLVNSSTNGVQGPCSNEEEDRQNERVKSTLQIMTQADVSEDETNHEEEECFDIETGDYENASVLNASNEKHDLVAEANEKLITMQEVTDGNHAEASATKEKIDLPVNQEENKGSRVISETEICDQVKTIEQLKASLEAEKKALNDLYAELEEERSASAIAANQTMAMITRLQEEKSAMQMEALQYQRMMEEQAEYDQEALQLLNELMIKREKEKQELEKELETYRQKVSDFEAKEKMRMMRSSRDGSVQSKFSEESDEIQLSIDLIREARNGDDSFYRNGESSGDNTPADAVLSLEEVALDCINNVSILDESLTEYEEERLLILNQLKVLEEKLLTIADKEFIEDVRAIRRSSYEVDEDVANCDSSTKQEDEFAEEDNHNHQERTTMVSMAKSLLPLLDATGEEELICETQLELEAVEMQEYSASKLDLDSDKLAIIEQVDHVYERLQALEEDRDFLKNCIGSIKKGDKGLDLLQEILQHLRDLRAAELNGDNTTDD